MFNWPQNGNWLHCTLKYENNFGSLSKVGRWKKEVVFDFKLCRIVIASPDEAIYFIILILTVAILMILQQSSVLNH